MAYARTATGSAPPDAPVTIEVFNDLQCDELPRAVPLHDSDPGHRLRARRRRSPRLPPLLLLERAPEELGFYGAEAAAEQGYAWPYIYLFFRNQDEAERVGIDRGLPDRLAGAIPELDVPAWRDYLDAGGELGRPDLGPARRL